jgi:hypothetical protein
LCLTVRVIHKNSLLLNQHNGDDTPSRKQICVLHIQSDTTIFHLVVQ